MEWSIKFMAEMRSMVRSVSNPVKAGPEKCAPLLGGHGIFIVLANVF